MERKLLLGQLSRTDNSTFKKMSLQWLNGILCAAHAGFRSSREFSSSKSPISCSYKHYKDRQQRMKQILIFAFLFLILTISSFGQSSDQKAKLLPKDFKDIFQIAIDLQQLQKFYHIDNDTSRKQIVFQFFENDNYDNLKGVTKFGRQVVIMTEVEIKQRQIKSYFVVSELVCVTNSVRLQLEYPIEGLLVSYMFKKTNENWTIVNFNLTEK